MAGKVVFVTGGSGFIGFQIVTHLLELGYSVRAAARGPKANLLRNALLAHHDESRFTVVDIPDLFNDDLSGVLEGAYGVIHAASPAPGRVDAATALMIATTGALHIARSAVRAGIKRMVVTSSIFSFPFGGPWGVDDYNPITKEEALSGNPVAVYIAQKKLADKVLADFSERNPIDISLLAPGTTFGPFAPGFELLFPDLDYKGLSTNSYLHALLRPHNTCYPHPIQNGSIDVRDVSRAHVLALESRPGRKRYPIVSPEQCSYGKAIEIIHEHRPELRRRLCYPETAPKWRSFTLDVDRAYIERTIGFEEGSYIPWRGLCWMRWMVC
ncbi:NAD(P)-binding protein [Hymenopellis radicata]|nr:NAD(P)-binding protein [Hymenopellis radicata]